MILSAQSIRAYCSGFLRPQTIPLVHPFYERTVERGMSFGLSSCGYDVRIAEDHYIEPGGFVLGSTMEQFCLPIIMMAVVHDKSSWGRKGLAVQNTVLEPGWSGYLTLELSNHSKEPIQLHTGQPIAQIVFHMLDAATEQPYTGKYQNQEAGPQQVRYE